MRMMPLSKGQLPKGRSLANHSAGHNREGLDMSVQPPAAPHRVTIADIQIPFWRMVVILIKWTLAAIPAVIIVSIIFGIIGALIGGGMWALFGNMTIPGVKM
jgi:hypothetical protein